MVGGFFERMIQVLKHCLRMFVGQAKLTYQELLTSVAKVELIVNSRPLIYMEPLTPSHLIFGKRLMSLPNNFYYAEPEDSKCKQTFTFFAYCVRSLLESMEEGVFD